MRKNWSRYAALLCSTAMAPAPAAGCLAEEPRADQRDIVQEQENPASIAIAGFSVSLLKGCFREGENITVSPVSVMAALDMPGNGAEGEALAQLKTIYGMGFRNTITELNYRRKSGRS